jgi:PEP-CTERM motif
MRKALLLGSAAAFLAALPGLASATVVTVTGTYVITQTAGQGGTSAEPTINNNLATPFTENLTVGSNYTNPVNFFSATPANSCNNNCGMYLTHPHEIATDTLTATFSFTTPTGATGELVDTGAYTANYYNDTDSITWNSPDPLIVTFSNGVQLSVKLNDASDWTITPTIQFDPTGGPTPTVPEPASIALFGVGLLGLAGITRLRSRT